MSKLSVDELLAQATGAVLIEGEIAGTAWQASQEGHLLTAGHVSIPVNESENWYLRHAAQRVYPKGHYHLR